MNGVVSMNFDWTSRSVEEWRTLLARVPRANYLQSLPFARAVRLLDQKATRLAVLKKDDAMVGMMALQEIKLGPVHVLYLYRGPLWFTEHPGDSWLAEFAQLFNQTYPRRFLRRRRWLPEWRDSETAQKVLAQHGFQPARQSYETIWLDLTQTEDKLRASLKQKWRNALNKGEREDVLTHADWEGKTAGVLLKFYDEDRKAKKYHGRSSRFIQEEIKTALSFNEVVILWGVHDNQVVAGIMILLHGHSASYRIGWSSPAGRQCNAHNVLLWEAVKTLKAKGVHFFDLGGVEPSTAEGLTHFKEGMGGEKFKTPGMYL